MSIPDAVVALSYELRDAGAPVSVSETADAIRALQEIPIEKRTAFKAALATTLVKDPADKAIFERLFEIFFPLTRAPQEENGARGDGRNGNAAEEMPDELNVRERLSQAVKEMDPDALREIAQRLVEEEAGIEPQAKVSDEHYRYRALRGLDIQELLRRLVEEDVAGKGLSALGHRMVEEDFDERMKKFSDEVAEEIRRRRRQGLDVGQQVRQERNKPPEEVDFLWANDAEIEQMRAALYPLARRLALRLSQKRRAARRGRLDVRRTIRHSLSSGGVLLEPQWRKPSAGKPEMWVLCDISGSMRSFARFTLELVYALSTQFQRVRSFVFVDSLDEVTHLLEVTADFSTALERIDAEAKVVQLDGQSWYGNCFAQLQANYGRELTPRATLLILGDARNNMRTSGAPLLRDVRRSVRKVWWLNPEPKQYWDSADSIAGEFMPHVDAMFECRNLKQLEAFVAKAL